MQRSDTSSADLAVPPATSRRGWYPWAVVGMLWFICFFNYADRMAISTVLPALEEEFGFTKTQQGTIAAAFMWVYALSAPLAGGIGDRANRKYLILGGLYVWSVVTGFTALCGKLWQFVFVRGAEGLGETFYFPASMSLVSDYHAPRTRSRAMSLHQTSVYAGTVGGAWFAGWMTLRSGDWRYPFIILGAGGVVLGLALAVFIREPRRNEAERLEKGEPLPDPSSALTAADSRGWLRYAADTFQATIAFAAELFANPAALLLLMAFCGANFTAFVFITWMPTFLKQNYQLDLAEAGFAATFYMQVASMCGAIAGGFLADFWGKYRVGGRSLVQGLGALGGAPFIFWCGNATSLSVVIGTMIGFGFFKGIYDSNIWASLYDVVPAAKRGTAVGLTNMVGWIGGALGSTLFGVAIDNGISMNMAISSTVVIYISVAAFLALSAWLAPRFAAGGEGGGPLAH